MEKNKTHTLKQKLNKKSLWQKPWFYLVIIGVLILTGIGLYQIPAVGDRAYYYVANARAKVQYFFHPPAEASFNPQGQGTLLPGGSGYIDRHGTNCHADPHSLPYANGDAYGSAHLYPHHPPSLRLPRQRQYRPSKRLPALSRKCRSSITAGRPI